MDISSEALAIIEEVNLLQHDQDAVQKYLASFDPKFVAEAMIVFAKANKLNIGDVRHRSGGSSV